MHVFVLLRSVCPIKLKKSRNICRAEKFDTDKLGWMVCRYALFVLFGPAVLGGQASPWRIILGTEKLYMAEPLQHKPDHFQSWPAVSVYQQCMYHMSLIPEHMHPLDHRRGAKIVISALSFRNWWLNKWIWHKYILIFFKKKASNNKLPSESEL